MKAVISVSTKTGNNRKIALLTTRSSDAGQAKAFTKIKCILYHCVATDGSRDGELHEN